MKTLYLDCGMGAAGDMLTAALLELLPDADAFIEELNALSIPEVTFRKETVVRCGIKGTHIAVAVHGVEESEELHNQLLLRREQAEQDHCSHENGYAEQHNSNHENGHAGQQNSDHENGRAEQHHCSHENGHAVRQNSGHHHEPTEQHNGNCEYAQEEQQNRAHQQEHQHSRAHQHECLHSHVHRGIREIEEIVLNLKAANHIKTDILAVYHLIAQAESQAHGAPVSEIHFHEVGAMDAIADITAVCMLMDRLSPDQVVVSPIHVGSGQVKCAHGILPVPAPATAFILKNAPIYGGEIKSELCTPTGAALLMHFATRFGSMPTMKVHAIGYGMGKKEFAAANCVRAMFGEQLSATDETLELSCNVDDMTAEAVGYLMERLFDGGARDVYTTPIGMKKSRPGLLIRVICDPKDRESMICLLFKHSTTIGIRENAMQRYILERSIETLHTPYGEVRAKKSYGYGVLRYKYEFRDLAGIAKERNISLEEAGKLIEEWRKKQ